MRISDLITKVQYIFLSLTDFFHSYFIKAIDYSFHEFEENKELDQVVIHDLEENKELDHVMTKIASFLLRSYSRNYFIKVMDRISGGLSA